jgi:hypothetical protein
MHQLHHQHQRGLKFMQCLALQVYARLKFHPGVTLLHSAAQYISSKLAQAAAAGSARMSTSHIMSLLQSYAMLAYAPPKALLQQLRQQLQPQVLEADPSALASSLWCFCLFKDLSPELWNGAMGLLAQPAVAPAMTPAALSQLYQVGLWVLVVCCNGLAAQRCSALHVLPCMVLQPLLLLLLLLLGVPDDLQEP